MTSLTVTDFIELERTSKARKDTAANLGVLTLAAILRERGYHVDVANLDQWFMNYLGSGADRPAYFFPFAAERLAAFSAEIFGFSSICSSYPLSLRLATAIKTANSESVVILGGPQASVTDGPAMRAFPCIDFVVRGEADHTLPVLCDVLSGRDGHTSLESIPGITFRRGDTVVRNPDAELVCDLDSLPLPAFDLDPDIVNRGGVHLEIGRGCPFACTFCSTNQFFRRHFRLKSPQKMIEQMKRVRERYGLNSVSLVHDMYTIDRRKVAAFCEALLGCGEEFVWSCSARADCVDDDLIALMARAGCKGIFFGIETGSNRLQQVINKKLNLGEARRRIQCADRHGIETAVALITAFPDETRDDLRDTIHFFIDSLPLEHGEPQLSLLAPLAGTPIYEEQKEHLAFDQIFSDVSHQGWRQDPADVEMAKAHPGIFPNFYSVPTRWMERSYFSELRDFVTFLASWFRWVLPVALRLDSGDFLKVFDRWKVWLAAHGIDSSAVNAEMVPYYCQRQFRKDFLAFVRECYLEEMAAAPLAVAAAVAAEELCQAAAGETPERAADEAGCFDPACVPSRVDHLRVMHLGVDYKELVAALKTGGDLGKVPEQEVTVVNLPTAERRIQIYQLAPLSAVLLNLCDGSRSVEEIGRQFSALGSGVDGVPADKVCLFGLILLAEEGFIRVPARAAQPAAVGESEGEALDQAVA